MTVGTSVIWNLKGTFTDLQSRIDAASRSVTLPYDFTYNGEVDNHDNLSRGIHFSNEEDSDTFTVWGNHHTISGNNSASIFHIGEYDTVVLNGVTMLDGYYSDNGGAVYSVGNLNLISCTIANCRDDENNSVYSENGTLRLEHNTVQGGVIYIANLINSQTHAVVLENRYHYTYDAAYNLTAIVADDDGNIIHDAQFKFIVNGNEVEFTSYSEGVYVCENYAISPGYVYHVSASSINEPGMDVKDGGIMQLNGTFTDLKEQIDASSGVLDLAYNFTFNSEIDNSELRNGIGINKDLVVNGHGYTISGSNSASIFDIANHAVILNNVTFADGFHSTKGGAVSSNGNLTIKNSTFINCRNNAGHAIYIGGGTLSLDGNDVGDYIIYNGGKIVSPITAVVLDNDSYYAFAGNMVVLNATLTDDNGNRIYDPDLRFTVNGASVGTAPGYSNGMYTCNFNVGDERKYVVGVAGGESGLGNQSAVIWNIKGTFTDLQTKIDSAVDVLDLTYDFTYYDELDGCGGLNLGVNINKNLVVNGNGYTVRGNASSIMTIIGNHEVILNNITFTDGLRESSGGAVYFDEDSTGKIINCNFISNTAGDGGGAVCFKGRGTVANCNFADNSAVSGGAVYFFNEGNVTNCNFNGNDAAEGSAIYFGVSQNAKTISNSIFLNNKADAEALNVTQNGNNIAIIFTGNDNLLNAIYSTQDVSFTNVTYWGANGITNTGSSAVLQSPSNREAGQNITIVGVVNGKIINTAEVTDENGTIVLEAAGDYMIVVSHDADSYYTEAKAITTNMKFYANVTSVTTDSRTVNITAKSNIPNEIIEGELLYILPDGGKINAAYGTNGTWWAVHTFDDCAVYEISASYRGLDNIIIGNATITINKIKTVLTANSVTAIYNVDKYLIITLKDSKGNPIGNAKVTVVLNGAKTYVTDKNGQVKVSTKGLAPKTYTAKATFAGDAYHVKSAKDVKVTVKKATPKLTAKNIKLKKSAKVKKYSVTLKTNTKKAMKKVKITLKIKGKKTLTAKTNSKGKATFKIKNLKKKGTFKATVTFKGNKYYNKVAKKVKITIR